MALPPAIVTKDPQAVAAYVTAAFGSVGWGSSRTLIEKVIFDLTEAFAGRREGYLAGDMRYHDFGHTLQATVCISDLVIGQHRSGDMPEFGQRVGELCIIAAMLHDSGFLKLHGDDGGTGAKYTMVHENRSCEFARAYLPGLGVAALEIEDICTAIRCTGPRNRIGAHTFRDPTARRIACLLVTADYLAQMSAPDYVDRLDFLFAEFVEAFEWDKVPLAERPYRSAAELKAKTSDFWTKLIRPMLDTDAEGVHRYLSVTGQPNPYLQAVEDNLTEVRRRVQSGLVQV